MSRWAFAAFGLAVFLLLFARGMGRAVDLDEHQFVAPAVLWAREGLLPYADYPYFHTPGLIYVLGPLVAACPFPLFVARMVSVLCGTATTLLLFRAAWLALASLGGKARWLLCGGLTLTFLCSSLFAYTNGWSWNHDPAMLCALGAFFLHLRGLRRGGCGWFFLAGALAGLALDIRLSFAPIVIPLAIVLFVGRSTMSWRQRVLALVLAVGGSLLVLTPALVLLSAHFEQFRFGILGYARLSTAFYAAIHSKEITLAGKATYLARSFFSDPGNATLLLLAVYGLTLAAWKHRAWRSEHRNEFLLLVALLPALLIGVWGPSPVQFQYQYMLLPFLFLIGVYALALECRQGRHFAGLVRIVAVGIVLTVATGLPRWYWYVVTVPMVSSWVPVRAHETGVWINERCPPGARVLTIDPIFPLEGGLRVYPEFTTGRFVCHVGRFMSADDRRRYHMTCEEELDRLLVEQPPDAIFCDDRVRNHVRRLEDYAGSHGFRRHVYVEDSGPTIARIVAEMAPELERCVRQQWPQTQIFRDGEVKTYTLWVRPHDASGTPAATGPEGSNEPISH